MTQQNDLSVDQALLRLAYDLMYNNVLTSMCIDWALRYNKPIFHDSIDDYLEEELYIERCIHKFNADPKFRERFLYDITGMAELDEEWLKEEMGDTYIAPGVSPEDVVKSIINTGGEIHDDFNSS